MTPEVVDNKNITPRRLVGFDVPPKNDFLESRTPLMLNNDVIINVAAPKESMKDYFYKNGHADELIFVHQGRRKTQNLPGGNSIRIW